MVAPGAANLTLLVLMAAAFYKPRIGALMVLAMLPFATWLPVEVGFKTIRADEMVLLATVGGLVVRKEGLIWGAKGRATPRFFKSVTWYALSYPMSAIHATILGAANMNSVNLFYVLKWSQYVLVLLLFYRMGRSGDAAVGLRVFCLAAGMAAAAALAAQQNILNLGPAVAQLYGMQNPQYERTMFSFRTPNQFASYLGLAGLLVGGLGFLLRRRASRVLWGMLLGVVLAALVATGSRSALVAFVAGAAVLGAVRAFQRRGGGMSVLGAAVLGLLVSVILVRSDAFMAQRERLVRSAVAAGSAGVGAIDSVEVRLENADRVLETVGGGITTALFGVGRDRLFDYGFLEDSQYAQDLMRRGLVGLVLLVAMLTTIGVYFFRAGREARERAARGIAQCGLASVVMIGVNCAGLAPLASERVAETLWAIVGLASGVVESRVGAGKRIRRVDGAEEPWRRAGGDGGVARRRRIPNWVDVTGMRRDSELSGMRERQQSGRGAMAVSTPGESVHDTDGR